MTATRQTWRSVQRPLLGVRALAGWGPLMVREVDVLNSRNHGPNWELLGPIWLSART